MIQRIIIGMSLVVATIVAIWFSMNPLFTPFFALAFSFLTALILWEFYRLAEAKGHQPLSLLGAATGFSFTLAVFTVTQDPHYCFLPYLTLILSLLFGFFLFLIRGENPVANLSITYFGMIYLAVPLSCLLLILFYFPPHETGDGRWWLFFAIAVTKMTDTGAYFGGKLIGIRPLAPMISPKKTIEGALAGFIIAVASSIAIPYIASAVSGSKALPLSLSDSIWLGFVIAFLAQIGDLSESLLKRDAKIKDSSRLPGLGGGLDIIDSLVFTLPLVYGYISSTSQS